MNNGRYRGTFGNNGIASFGGLTFANNKFEFADPVYDDLHALSEQRANTWYQNKAGVEQTTDFINAQSVLDKDQGIKDSTLTKFTDHIKPFVDNARYEEASFALTDAVRNFQNDKGFALATSNYKVYSEWSQKQRDKKGWDDNDKNLFIKAVSDQYDGVKVHEDGTVSGAFNGKDMGEYVNIQEKLAPMLKDWTPDEVDQVLGGQNWGMWGDTTYWDKKTIKSKNGKAIAAYAKNFIQNDPEIQKYLETRNFINQNRSHADIANRVINSIANSKGDQFQFQQEYAELSKLKTTKGAEAKLEFERMYARRDDKGNPVLDADGKLQVDPFLHAFRSQMISSGMLDATDLNSNAADLYRKFSNVMQQASKLNVSRSDLQAIMDKQRSGQELSFTEQVALKGETYRQSLAAIDDRLYVADQSYNAFLPHSGVSETISNLRTLHDPYFQWQAGRAAEKKARELALLTTQIGLESPPMYKMLEEKGTDAFMERIKVADDTVTNLSNELNGFIGTFEKAINDYNAKDENVNKIPVLTKAVKMIGDGYTSLNSLSPAQIAFLQKTVPGTFKDYTDKLGTLNSTKAQKEMDNGLFNMALSYAEVKDKDNYPTDEKLQHDYQLLLKGGSITPSDFKLDKILPNSVMTGGTAFSPARQMSFNEFKEATLNNYKTSNEHVKAFIKDHVAAGFTTDMVSFDGIRYSNNGDPVTNQAKSVLEAIDNEMMSKIKNGTKYRVISGKGITYDNTGGKAEIYGDVYNSSIDISHGRLLSTYVDQSTGKKVYRYAVTDDLADKGVSNPKAYVDMDDAGLQYQELLRAIKPGLMDNEAANSLDAMESISSYNGKVNYTEALPNLFNTGSASISFNAGNLSRPVGTLRIDFSTYDNPSATNPEDATVVNRSANGFIYTYQEDGKMVNKTFDNYGQAIQFINSKCNEYIAGVTNNK